MLKKYLEHFSSKLASTCLIAILKKTLTFIRLCGLAVEKLDGRGDSVVGFVGRFSYKVC